MSGPDGGRSRPGPGGEGARAGLSEERVYARHQRRTGAVLVVGVGAVGGFLAEELARLGCSPLQLVDPDVLEVENLVRHPLGAGALGQPKASALAGKIRSDFPPCEAAGLDADFLGLPAAEQTRLAGRADVVVAATDSIACQRRVNVVALAAGKPALYPAVWVDPRIRDAEVGELLWVLPGGRTPCYACAAAFRGAAADAQAARGARVDVQLVALTAAQVVAALLGSPGERKAVLDPARNAIYLHGLTSVSEAVRATFPLEGLQSRNVRVPFPAEPCPACGGREPPAPRAPAGPALQPEQAAADADGTERLPMMATLVTAALILIAVTGLLIGLLVSAQPTRARCASTLLAGAGRCQTRGGHPAGLPARSARARSAGSARARSARAARGWPAGPAAGFFPSCASHLTGGAHAGNRLMAGFARPPPSARRTPSRRTS